MIILFAENCCQAFHGLQQEEVCYIILIPRHWLPVLYIDFRILTYYTKGTQRLNTKRHEWLRRKKEEKEKKRGRHATM